MIDVHRRLDALERKMDDVHDEIGELKENRAAIREWQKKVESQWTLQHEQHVENRKFMRNIFITTIAAVMTGAVGIALHFLVK